VLVYEEGSYPEGEGKRDLQRQARWVWVEWWEGIQGVVHYIMKKPGREATNGERGGGWDAEQKESRSGGETTPKEGRIEESTEKSKDGLYRLSFEKKGGGARNARGDIEIIESRN